MQDKETMKYKIWLYIEEIDEETDHYEDVYGPESTGCEFDSLEEAIACKEVLLDAGYTGEKYRIDKIHKTLTTEELYKQFEELIHKPIGN